MIWPPDDPRVQEVAAAWSAVSVGGYQWPTSIPPVAWEDALRQLSTLFSMLPHGNRWRVPEGYAAFIANQLVGWQWFDWFEVYGPELVVDHTQSWAKVWDYRDGDGLWLAIGSWASTHTLYLGCDPEHLSWGQVIDASDCHPLAGQVVSESFLDFLRGWLSTALATYRERHTEPESDV
jgi:hypothetical protein